MSFEGAVGIIFVGILGAILGAVWLVERKRYNKASADFRLTLYRPLDPLSDEELRARGWEPVEDGSGIWEYRGGSDG